MSVHCTQINVLQCLKTRHWPAVAVDICDTLKSFACFGAEEACNPVSKPVAGIRLFHYSLCSASLNLGWLFLYILRSCTQTVAHIYVLHIKHSNIRAKTTISAAVKYEWCLFSVIAAMTFATKIDMDGPKRTTADFLLTFFSHQMYILVVSCFKEFFASIAIASNLSFFFLKLFVVFGPIVCREHSFGLDNL